MWEEPEIYGKVTNTGMQNCLLALTNHTKPFLKTLTLYLKSVLCMSGVDTSKFMAGSVRSAAAWKAKVVAVPVTCIMQKAG